jgi:hypothetical protein
MKRFLWLGFVVCVYLICTGCGDTFRPIIVPNPPTFPNPQAAHTVVSINDNGTVVPGSAMVVDVSGDTDVSEMNVGLAPVNAVQQTAFQVLVANHSVSGPLNVGDSITKLNFSGTVISSAATISLPPNSAPNFVTVAPTDTQAYVTLPNLVPDPINHPGVIVPSVGVVNTQSNSLVATIAVGNEPFALAVTPDKNKLYVANLGDGTVSGFNTLDRSSRGINGSLSSPPIWLTARNDSQRVYVLEQTTGTLASIDTSSTSGPDTLSESTIEVPGATIMVYDSNLNRLYIPGGPEVAMVDVSQSPPQYLAGGPITITPVLGSARAQGDLCSAFNPTGVTAVAATALPDGSRAYVGSYSSFEVGVKISHAMLNNDGVHTTYSYTLLSPGAPDLLPGMVVTIAGVISTGSSPSAFNGTFQVISVGGGTFQVANTPAGNDIYTSGGAGAASNICPQVTVINAVSKSVKSSIAIPGVPTFNGVCASTRFRFMMAAGGDSTRAYLSTCDGGNVNIINTSNDTYIENLPAPVGTRAPIPPSLLNPPQNPVFLIAGP